MPSTNMAYLLFQDALYKISIFFLAWVDKTSRGNLAIYIGQEWNPNENLHISYAYPYNISRISQPNRQNSIRKMNMDFLTLTGKEGSRLSKDDKEFKKIDFSIVKKAAMSIPRSSVGKKHPCPFDGCKKDAGGIPYKNTSQLKDHLFQNHAKRKKTCCVLCRATFTRKAGLFYHMNVHFKIFRTECMICGENDKKDKKKIKHMGHLKSHYVTIHHMCVYCTAWFGDQQSVIDHQEREHPQKTQNGSRGQNEEESPKENQQNEEALILAMDIYEHYGERIPFLIHEVSFKHFDFNRFSALQCCNFATLQF